MKNAKTMGYKVIDEFGTDISSIVYVIAENNEIKVFNEFGVNIVNIVKVSVRA